MVKVGKERRKKRQPAEDRGDNHDIVYHDIFLQRILSVHIKLLRKHKTYLDVPESLKP